MTYKHACDDWNVLVDGRPPRLQPIISEKVLSFFFFFPLWSILPVFLKADFFCRQSRIFSFDEIYYSSCKNVLCSRCTLWFKWQLCFIWFILFITIDFDVHKRRILDSWAAMGCWIHPDQLLMLFLLIQESCWAHYRNAPVERNFLLLYVKLGNISICTWHNFWLDEDSLHIPVLLYIAIIKAVLIIKLGSILKWYPDF